MVLIFGMVAIVLSLVQAVLMLFRQAALVILAGVLPLAAAGSLAPLTRPWIRKITSWMLALICYKPAAAAVYATAFTMIGSGKSPRTVLMGFVMLLLSVLTLPALMKFFTWTTGAVASSGGGGQLLGAAAVGAIAVGAMRSPGGAGGPAQDQAAYLSTRLGPPPGGAAPGGRPATQARPASQTQPGPPPAGSGSPASRSQRAHRNLGRNTRGQRRTARLRRRSPPAAPAAAASGRSRVRAAAAGPSGAAAAAAAQAAAAAARQADGAMEPGGHRDDHGHDQVRTYGGWRRSRSIGLLGLGPAAHPRPARLLRRACC